MSGRDVVCRDVTVCRDSNAGPDSDTAVGRRVACPIRRSDGSRARMERDSDGKGLGWKGTRIEMVGLGLKDSAMACVGSSVRACGPGLVCLRARLRASVLACALARALACALACVRARLRACVRAYACMRGCVRAHCVWRCLRACVRVSA